MNKITMRFPHKFWPDTNWFVDLEPVPPFGIMLSSLDVIKVWVRWCVGGNHGEIHPPAVNAGIDCCPIHAVSIMCA
jgi:hypothetical protein